MASTSISAPAGDLERGPTSDGKPKADSLEGIVGAVERHSVWALSGLMALSAAVLLYMGRGLSFFYDEWEWVIHDHSGGLHWLFVAHVGNISVFPAAVYRALFYLIGLNHYAVFRLDVIALHLICGALVYVTAARRIARPPALLAAALILFLGAAWEDLLWGFQIGYLLSVSGGLATWVLLEEKRRFTDVAAMACLVVAAGSSSIGIPVMVGVAVELWWRREDRRRIWIVLVPAALYVLWYLGYGVSQVTEKSLIHAPVYFLELVAAAFGGLVGRNMEWGRPLALLGLLAVLFHLARRRTVSARLVGLLAAASALWTVTAVARSTYGAPESSRYIYLGAVLIVLVGVELLRGVTITPLMSVIATLVIAVCAFAGLTLLRAGAVGLRETSKTVTAELGALEIAAAYAPPEYRPDWINAPPVYAGPYLRTVHSIGSSPADTPAEILASEPPVRAAADTVLMAVEAPRLRTPPAPRLPALALAPTVASLSGATMSRDADCVRVTPLPGARMSLILTLGGTGLLIRNEGVAVVSLAARRFGEAFDLLRRPLAAHSEGVLSRLSDAYSASIPWRLRLGSASRISLCGLPA